MSEDTIVYIYSKHSKSCDDIRSYIEKIYKVTKLVLIDADDVNVRNYLLKLKLFHTVPCMILSYPVENRMEIYEGLDVISLCNKMLSMYGFDLISFPSENLSMRLSKTDGGKSEGGKTMLNFDEKKQIAVKIEDIFENDEDYEEDEEEVMYTNNYQDRLTNPNLNIKKGNGHETMRSSLSSIPSDNVSDSVDESLLITPTEMNYNDLVGPNGPPVNKEAESKHEKIKSAASSMMAEREKLDSQYVKKI